MGLELRLVRSDGTRMVDVHHADEIIATFDLDTLKAAMPQRAENERLSDKSLSTAGRVLFEAIGGARLADLLGDLPTMPNPDGVLSLHMNDSALVALPWEILHHDDFLAQDYGIVRVIPTKNLPPAPDSTQPWRLVVQGSDPLLAEVRDPESNMLKGTGTMRPLQVVQELETLERTLAAANPPVPIRWQRIAPTAEGLTNLATGREPILFHYTGHGDIEKGEPILCYDDGAGMMKPQHDKSLLRRLRQRTYLAFLNACRTADDHETESNLALALVQGGIPAVLGTWDTIPDVVAAELAFTFYQHLAQGEPPSVALYWARMQVTDKYPVTYWLILAIYMAEGYTFPRQSPPTARFDAIPLPPLKIEDLPAPAHLRGREIELVEIASAYVHHGKKVVTIRGAGGMGKTVLGYHLAHRLRFFFTDGIYAYSFANRPVSDYAFRKGLMDTLGASHPAFDDPTHREEQEKALLALMQSRPHALLIVDNYESVLGLLGRDEGEATADSTLRGEAEAVQRMVFRLAETGAHLLFTSRNSPVGINGEWRYPDDDHHKQLGGLLQDAALDLFRDHAGNGRRYTKTFALDVIHAVEAHPLSIVLAASRWAQDTAGITADTFIKDFYEHLIQAENIGLAGHQISVVANAMLSINALTEEQRTRFLALTLVANPFIFAMHGAVLWGLEDDERWFTEQAHAILQLLEGRSLLQGIGRDEKRNLSLAYTIQPVIRQVAQRLATEELRATSRHRYAEWAARLANRGYLTVNEDADLASYVQQYLSDLEVAPLWLPAETRGLALRQTAWLLQRFARPDKVEALLAQAETDAADTDNEQLLSSLYYERANYHRTQGDYDAAMLLYQQSLDLTERLGDLQGKAATLYAMAYIFRTRGNYDEAMHRYQQSLDLTERLDELQGKGATLHAMAYVFRTRGDYDEAMHLYQQSLEIDERLGDLQGKGATLHEMASIFVNRGDYDAALRLYQQSLDIYERLDDLQGKGATLHSMADIFVNRGDYDAAMRLYQESLNIKERLSDLKNKGATLHAMAYVLRTRGDYDGAMHFYQQSLDLTEHLGDLQGKAATLAMAAQVLIQQGRQVEAVTWLREGLHILEKLGATPDAAKVRQILAQVEGSGEGISVETMARQLMQLPLSTLVAQLIAFTTRGLTGEMPRPLVTALLDAMPPRADLTPLFTVLKGVLAGNSPQQVNTLYNVVAALFQNESDWGTMGDAWWGVGNIADACQDPNTEQKSREVCIDTLRNTTDNKGRESLYNAVRKLAAFHFQRREYIDAVPYLEEVLQLAQALGKADPDTEGALATARRRIAGEDEPATGISEADIEALPPEQRAVLAILQQIAPAFQQVAQHLRDPQVGAPQREQIAEQVLQMAHQAVEGEDAGSLWLDAAAALRLLAARVRGQDVDITTLPDVYQSLWEAAGL